MSDQPTKYRKKPVVIEAIHWHESLTPAEAHALTSQIETWGHPWLLGDATRPNTLKTADGHRPVNFGMYIDPADGHLVLRTLEGDMKVSLGDYIIRGVMGEVYPCKPDIFAATYEAAETTPSRPEALDVAELRRLAEAATPGPWEAIIFDSGHSKFEFEASVCTQDVGDSICRMDGLLRTADNERYRTDGSLDAAFIAAASPDVVLGLLDRLAHMREARDNARAEVERLAGLIEAVKRIGLGTHLGRTWPGVLTDMLRALDGEAGQ